MPYFPALRDEPRGLATQSEALEALATDAKFYQLGGSRECLNLGRWCDDKGNGGDKLIYSGDRHGLLFGPTGTGKTTRWLMSNLLHDNLLDASVVVTDPKGELACVTAPWRVDNGHVVRIIDPFGKLAELVKADPRKYNRLIEARAVESVGFNPMQILDPQGPLFYDDAAALSEALIEVEEKDPHWGKSAQGLLTGLIMWEKIKHGKAASLPNVRQMLTEATASENIKDADGKVTVTAVAGLAATCAEVIAIAADSAMKANPDYQAIDIVSDLLARFKESNREIESIKSTADTQTRWLLSPLVSKDLAKPGFSFADLKRQRTSVYLIIPAERMRTYSGWIRMLVVSALRSLYSAGGLRTVFLLDEMPAFGYLPPLADAFGVVRGFNMQIVGIAQDLVQLEDLYKTRWESFIANTGFTQFFAPNDLTTAEWISKRAGDHAIEVYGMNRSETPTNDKYDDRTTTGENLGQQWVPLFRPQDLMGFPTGTGLLFYSGLTSGIRFLAPRYDHITLLQPRAAPTPF